jgi:hypothetical protein
MSWRGRQRRSRFATYTWVNNFIDADTGCKLRRTTEIVYDNSGSFGQCLCNVAPVLVCSNVKGQDIRIGKMSVLVKLNKRQPQTVFERLARSFAG